MVQIYIKSCLSILLKDAGYELPLKPIGLLEANTTTQNLIFKNMVIQILKVSEIPKLGKHTLQALEFESGVVDILN